MKIALIGTGKMGQAIEQLAINRGHEIVLKLNHENISEVNIEELKSVLYEEVKTIFKIRYPYNNFLY